MAASFLQRNARQLSTLAFVFLMLAIGGLIWTSSLLGHDPVSLGLQGAAFLLMLWARVTFGLRSFHYAANPTEGGLVTTGPYRYVRHPIYAAILLFVWVAVAANWSLTNAAFGAVATAMLFLRMICEEALVRQRYPEYDAYARRTKRVIPFVL
ncbi:MAG TPA: isoprenylcysteine carboxylmethyltransferase family protein [Thermoanaerobaculia bacterium]|jgi:protein-S-isoprenylcysteine O-methyltransferase Ste14|nr:isoprenylcysteine carboxylmethyltransferase family protein [Thermoanaerobaculia bacterium]